MVDREQINVEEADGISIVRFISNKILDDMVVQKFGTELLALIEQSENKSVILDFESVDFLSSAALGHLIKLDKRAKASDSKLVLCNIKTSIYEVFTITRLDTVFNIKPTRDDAVAELKK